MSKYALILGGICLIAIGCSKDEKYSEDEKLTQTEVKTILETDDAAKVVDGVLSELYMNDGKNAKSGKSNECYAAEYTDTGYTVTFNNCVLNGTDNVNGTLTVVYATSENTAAFTATYADFYVGNIKINGTRSYELIGDSEEGSVSFSVTSSLEVVLANEEVISENGTKTFTLVFGDSLETTTYSIDGNWTLQVDGHTYKVVVIDTLEGNFACGYLTTGVMTVDKNGLAVSVDFGDGSCDDMAVLTYPNGAMEDITLKD